MARYEKWLGAGLGWVVTGNPIGGLLGFIAGSFIGKGDADVSEGELTGVTEFETNLIVIASHLIKIDGKVSLEEISFIRNFFDAHFDDKLSEKRTQIIHHCLSKEYDLGLACDRLRMYTEHGTRIQVIRFLLDLAMSDGALNERENYFIFKIAGFINVNDIDYRKLRSEHTEIVLSHYEILGVSSSMSLQEIRNVYRQLVLKYHPDRNHDLNAEEKKKYALKFQQIKEAYEKIKAEKSA